MRHLKIHKFPFKECKIYLKIQQKLHCLGCVSKQTRDPSWRKQGWIPRRTISWWKASLPPQKESWAFFGSFSFHFLSFNGVFLTLKCRTFVLKHLHGDRAATICILLKMDICHYGFQIWQKWVFASIGRELHVSTPYEFLEELNLHLGKPTLSVALFSPMEQSFNPLLACTLNFQANPPCFYFFKNPAAK